jgi:tetratricopeptide (TPR) repeat protein
MPFGTKPDASGALIDFDAVYNELIGPAIREADLEPLRADEEMTGGIIHKGMFERLILCEFAVADLTTLNANVFYELGVRHAVRPYSTILLFAEGRRLPFDVSMLRALPYRLDDSGRPVNLPRTQAKLADLLEAARAATPDSPVFALVPGWKAPEVDPATTDTFRGHVADADHVKARLAKARRQGADAIRGVESEMGDIGNQDAGVVIDLFLSYRACTAWSDMVRLYGAMSATLRKTVMVREQLALAYNRLGETETAERILNQLIAERGPSSETYGILGRVYKDRWEKAARAGDTMMSDGLLNKAIDAYLKGFEADWRDAYPGINAVTLMELSEPPDERREQILPVVRYAVERRIASGKPDYWDYATVVELAVLGGDEKRARTALGQALASLPRPWETETTARNLRLINDARMRRGGLAPWMREVEDELERVGARTTLSA